MVSHLTPGTGRIRQIATSGFPAAELVQGEEVLAQMGRAGWWRIYFGRGQRIELPGGTSWRLRATGAGGGIMPVIVDSAGRRIVFGVPVTGGYGINGRDYAFRLSADGKIGFLRPDTWHLRRLEEETAVLHRRTWEVDAAHEVPVPVVLLAFSLAAMGIPGERRLGVPEFQWGVN